MLVWGIWQSSSLRTHVSCIDRQILHHWATREVHTILFFFFFNFIWMGWPHRSGYFHFENSRHGAFMKTLQIWQNWVHIPTWSWAEASSLRLHPLVSLVPPRKSPGLGAPATDVRCPFYRAAQWLRQELRGSRNKCPKDRRKVLSWWI